MATNKKKAGKKPKAVKPTKKPVKKDEEEVKDPPKELPASIAVTDEERSGIADIQRRLVQANTIITDLYLKKCDLEEQLTAVRTARKKINADLNDSTVEVAKKYGIDPDDKTVTWSLNIDSGVYTRVNNPV